ncbi:4-alpha-glucanotransferase [bacterium]|nr:4-alpha-glucanotransferase [bacterium]
MGIFFNKEKSDKDIIKEALKVLHKKNLALIIHSNSFPSLCSEDTGFGTANSQAGKNLIDYVSGVFNMLQFGPAGKTKSCDASPYTSTVFSLNPLSIDLKDLTSAYWGNILSESTYRQIVDENQKQNSGKTNYSYIYRVQENALHEAFDNFYEKAPKSLQKKFKDFKKDNAYWLSNDALYEALSLENGNDYWPLWKNKTDKYLLNPQSNEDRMLFGDRIKEIEKKYAKEIDFYCFCQFVAARQAKMTRRYAREKGIKLIADRQVAFSDRDTWAYQEMFMDGWCLGCPPDYFSKDGQAWGFPVLAPEKLFKPDGSLAKGGRFLKSIFQKMFKENTGGIRIDHIVGLIDPWVYKKGHKPTVDEGAGRLYSSPDNEDLAGYAIPSKEDLNEEVKPDSELRVENLTEEQIKEYAKTIEKILIAAAEEEGLNKEDIIFEDLGTLTNPVAEVMKAYGLLGMRLTQFVDPEKEKHVYRGKNIPKKCWAMTGSHDNKPIAMWAKKLVNTHEGYLHAKNLVEDVYPNAKNKDDLIVRMTNDYKFLMLTKFAELFTSDAENIQIFFTDYFGIEDVYNSPGTSGDKNWSLRLPNNFEDVYNKNLKDGLAFNLPLVLKIALESKDEKFQKRNKRLIEDLQAIIDKQ